MPSKDYNALIWEYIKSHGWSYPSEIKNHIIQTSPGIEISDGELHDTLENYVSSGFLVEKNGKYRAVLRLEPLGTWREVPEVQHFTWDARKEIAESPVELEKPKFRESKFKEFYTWFDQSERGTCVGHAVAMLMACNHFQNSSQRPTAEDLAVFERDLKMSVTGCPSPMIYDKHHYLNYSPQWIYHISRVLAGILNIPSGSYVEAGIDAMRKYGAVPIEDGCVTSKVNRCAPLMWPRHGNDDETLEYYKKIAEKHKIDGSITGRTFDDACDLIDKYGCIVCSVKIYRNYTSAGCKGLYPRIGASDPIGWHAQFSDSYSREKGEIYFWQSWGDDWSWDGGYKKDDFNKAVGCIIAPIDKTEYDILRALYCRVKITSNTEVSLYIDDALNSKGKREFAVMIPRGEEHIVSVIPLFPGLWVEPKITRAIRADGSDLIVPEFKFTRKSTPPTPPKPPIPPKPGNFLDWLREKLKKVYIF